MKVRGFKNVITPLGPRATWVAVVAFAVLAVLAMIRMPGRSFAGPLPAITAAEQALAGRLRGHVEVLAGRIGERNTARPRALGEAGRHIAGAFATLGLEVRRQAFSADGVEVANLEARRAGAEPGAAAVVVGAHYDSAPGSPAANDNATGVAALIEIARALRGADLRRPVRFVAFVNEEPPHFRTGTMGSLVYARDLEARAIEVSAMLSLETLGHYSDEPGSQRYPFPVGLFYPDAGNFVAFVGNVRSGALVRRCVDAFRRHASFPSEGASLPAWLPGVGWSDQWSFWEAGIPAVMVTDTAPFRYPWYHTAADTPDKVDHERLARVTQGLVEVVRALANAPDG